MGFKDELKKRMEKTKGDGIRLEVMAEDHPCEICGDRELPLIFIKSAGDLICVECAAAGKRVQK